MVSGYPHHTAWKPAQQTLFCDADYAEYKNLLSSWCARYGVAIRAYCLMPNHVHLIAVPHSDEALRGAISEAHRRYIRHINFRDGWRGHL